MMRRLTSLGLLVGAVFAITAAALGCASHQGQQQQAAGGGPSAAAHAPSALENGRSIFLTGRDVDGVQISAKTHPLFGNCAACHRADGSGGKHFPDGAVSADLRHKALVVEQKHPYTLALLERAISTGIDNEGKPLDPVMPHWRLSPRDLHDVAQYVQALK